MKDELSVGARYCGVPCPPCRVWNWPRGELQSGSTVAQSCFLLFLCTQQNTEIPERTPAC